jgi:integrase
MPKRNSDNLRIKRKYLVWLKDARGLSDATVAKAAASISTYEAFLDGKDFRGFHPERARAFKRHLTKTRSQTRGKPLSSGTINGILRDLTAFLNWLADQPGYKSKIQRADIAYLSSDRKSETARRTSCWKPHPSPAQVRALLSRMPDGTELERRDRALVAFLFLTGSRETAAVSLSLGQIDLEHGLVQFDGRHVDTKFGKSFTTAFYPIGGPAEQILRDWVQELRHEHHFSSTDPLFPRTKVGSGPDRRFTVLGIDRAPWSTASSAARIFKDAFRNAGLPPFSPHRVRDTLADLAREHCRTPEDYKAWSQNMGHEDVMTTFRSYGSVAPGRQVELMSRFRKRGPLPFDEDDMLIEEDD